MITPRPWARLQPCSRMLWIFLFCLSGTFLPAASIIWITEDTDAGNPPSPDDIEWTDLLTAAGHTVNRRTDIRNLDTDDAALAELEAADLVIMSRDTTSGNYASNATEVNRWNALTTPLIAMNVQIVRPTDRWRWFSSGAATNPAPFTIQVVEPGHPIFAGITLDANDQFEIADVGVTNPISATTAGNGTVLATEPGNGNVWIASWPANVAFYAGGPTAGGPRIFFAAGAGIATDNPKGGENFTADGERAFLNAVNLLASSATDSDFDGLADTWEITYFNDLSATPTGDPDSDGLTNLAEQAAHSHPKLADTDADGLNDKVETHTGVYVSPTNTGTDPAKADTDGDGLSDAVETATGTFVDATHTGTNPNTPDSDGDKFVDGEDLRRGFNPNLASSHPPELDILFIGANATPDFGADGAIFTYLEIRYGLGNVTYQQASATNTGDEVGHDVLVISSTPGSGDMRGKYQESEVPILNWEEAIADAGAGELGLSASGMSASTDTTLMDLLPHPITAGLPAQITYTSVGAQTTASSNLFAGVVSVATAADGNVIELVNMGQPMLGYSMVFVAEKGQDLDPATGISDGKAHARRVCFPMRDGTFALLTADGRTLFGQALDWAAGLTGNSSTDTDSDGLADTWEVTYFNNLTATASGDPDSDGLTNLAEQAAQTNPKLADTDADGLNDKAETKTGVYVNPTNTGTDPVKADTDGDGLTDGVETATGTFVDATHTGTDPNIRDSDGDKFIDGEDLRRGFNPSLASSHPPELDILFIGMNATPNFGADGAVFTYMENRYGLGNVTYLQATAAVAGDELTHDVLVLSSTPASGDVRGKFQESTVPILNWEEAIADNGAGEFGLSAGGMSASIDTTLMNLNAHPITAGLPAQITYTSVGAQTTATTTLFPGLTSVATAADGTINELVGVGNSMVDNPMVFVAEAGQDVDPGTGISDAKAHARRVYFPMRDGTFALLTPDGRTLFGQALDWAAGLIGVSASDLRIVDVDYVDHPTGPDIILKWTSQPGRTYSILGSVDLLGNPSTWTVMQSSVPSAGTETTGTVTVAAGTQKIFLVVKENP